MPKTDESLEKQGTTFEAELKAISVKPDGLEVKLKMEFCDSEIVQALATLMSERKLIVDIRPRVEQATFTFNAGVLDRLKAVGEK